MSRRQFVMFLPLLLAVSSVPSAAQVTTVSPAEAKSPTLDLNVRRDVVAKLSEALRERYVFPDIGEKAASKINAALTAGDYDALADPKAFTARLTADVGTIAHDKHLWLWSTDTPPAAPSGGGRDMPRAEAGVTRADRLAGSVGYIEVIGFPPPNFFKPVLDRAMSSLAGSRALIIDARRNGGGSPEGVAYLVSFLVAPGQPINDIVSRIEKTNDFKRQSYVSVPTPVSFAAVPVYVLTSKATFSGGEEFAYDVQALKRGTLIGEVTGGGANPTGFVDLGHSVAAMIPFGRAENPVTKTNWEGRGVQPDVSVPAGDALKVALEKAGQKPLSDIDAASLQRVFAPRSTPRPGSEKALRQLIAGIVSGKPDYAAMTPEQADRTRQQLTTLQAQLSPLGLLRSMKFHGPDMLGGDEYELRFANGGRMMALVLDSKGKIVAASTAIPLPAAAVEQGAPSRPARLGRRPTQRSN